MVQVLEELAVFTPLGIRFWDPVLDLQIRDDLVVEAWPDPGLRPVARARRTGSDVYAFHGLPGLLAVEHRLPEAESSPPGPRPYVVRVADRRRRFLPVAFRVELPLPYRGVFLAGAESSPIESSPSGFLLFAAATRPRPPWLAVVRGELADRDTGEPGSHALLRLDVDGEPSRYGLADAAGRFAVFLPYPAPVEELGGSPPGGSPPGGSPPNGSPPGGPRTPLGDRTFPVSLTVHRTPGGLGALPGTALPSYAEILGQPPARVWPIAPANGAPADGGVGEPLWSGELRWGRELVARTAGDSKLLISPSGSPP